MGEFKVTPNYARQNDVRYIYTGDPIKMNYRPSPDYPNFDQLRLQKDRTNMKHQVLNPLEYQKALAGPRDLPNSAAFRAYSRHGIRDVISRLYQHSARNRSQESALTEQYPAYSSSNISKLSFKYEGPTKATKACIIKRRRKFSGFRKHPDVVNRGLLMHQMPWV